MDASVDISQVKALEDFFKELSLLDKKKVFQAGYRRAAKPLIQTAQAFVPKRTGNLQRSIGVIMNPQDISMIVGCRKGGGLSADGWYGHIVEYGSYISGERFRRKTKASTGVMKGTHFLENAYNATIDDVIYNIEDEWHRAIDNKIVNINRKLKKK